MTVVFCIEVSEKKVIRRMMNGVLEISILNYKHKLPNCGRCFGY